ncbi:MAG: DUF3037 domain-containing protein [Verrucomicrobiota bacterium]
MSLVVNFAAIGFRPYIELGEFVNVGLVAVEAKSRFLAYKLLPTQRTRRITASFPEIDLTLYRTGLRRLEAELATLSIETNAWSDDVRQAVKSHPSQSDLFVEDGDTALFEKLTKPRTAPFFYHSIGTRLTTNLEDCVGELFGRFVEHWNVEPVDYEEKKLTRRIRNVLRENKLGRSYREAPWVGTEAYHISFPIAFNPESNDVPEKAIKPLNLTQNSPTRIYMHGDDWLARLRRLKRIGCLPNEMLFVVKLPDDDECLEAAKEICEGLERQGASVLPVTDLEGVIEFARIEEETDFSLSSE